MPDIQYTYHTPVLLSESIDGLNIKPGGVYVDVTFGGGGHSREILSRLTDGARLFSFDQDADAEKNITNAQPQDNSTQQETTDTQHPTANHQHPTPNTHHPSPNTQFTFVRSNFRYLKNWMRYYGVDHIDGLLADLGVSSHHFDDETRGFSFRFDAPLDMRMNKRAGMTAADIVNEYDEQNLADIFYLYGEMKNSRKIASLLVKTRQQKPIKTTQDFITCLEPLFRREREKKDMAKLFQALRIEVNHEMDALREMLQAATELLAPGGRLSVITYHSLEDRIVKNFIKTGNAEGNRITDFYGRVDTPYEAVNNKVITASDEEVKANPRSRSAKLRIAEKL